MPRCVASQTALVRRTFHLLHCPGTDVRPDVEPGQDHRAESSTGLLPHPHLISPLRGKHPGGPPSGDRRFPGRAALSLPVRARQDGCALCCLYSLPCTVQQRLFTRGGCPALWRRSGRARHGHRCMAGYRFLAGSVGETLAARPSGTAQEAHGRCSSFPGCPGHAARPYSGRASGSCAHRCAAVADTWPQIRSAGHCGAGAATGGHSPIYSGDKVP
jgi:hypothetical protein